MSENPTAPTAATAKSTTVNDLPLLTLNSDPLPGLIERNTLNLLIGSSKEGKTSLLLSELALLVERGEFLGASVSQRSRLGFLDMAHPAGTLRARIASAGLERLLTPTLLPAVSAISTEFSAQAQIGEYYSAFPQPGPQFLIIDGIYRLQRGNPNDSTAVGEFCDSLRKFMIEKDVTVLATTLQAKQRTGDSYGRASEKAFGSAVWTASASALALLELMDAGQPEQTQSSIRRLIVMPPTGIRDVSYYDFGANGRLTRITAPDGWQEILIRKLLAIEPGTEITKTLLVEWGSELGIGLRSVESWITARKQDLTLEDAKDPETGRLRRGVYILARKM